MTPDPALVLELIDGFRRSKTMFAALNLGVFDLLQKGPADVATIATATGTNQDAVERLLDACVGLGLLSKQDPGYANQPVAGAYLCHSSPYSVSGYVAYSSNVLFRLWANLEDAVREGSHRWQQTFNVEGPIFDHFFRTEDRMRTFIMGMHGFGVLSSPQVASGFDLGRFRRLVDLGGATGHLVIAACERYPGLHGVVFDLAPVIRIAREHVDRSSARDRIELVAGDFFTNTLPEADLFSLGRILHDWSEEKVGALLRRIFDRLPAGGGLLIAEKLLYDDKTGPVPAHMQSLNMLVCTEGKERTLAEYTALLRRAGFQEVEGRRTGAPLDALLAIK